MEDSLEEDKWYEREFFGPAGTTGSTFSGGMLWSFSSLQDEDNEEASELHAGHVVQNIRTQLFPSLAEDAAILAKADQVTHDAMLARAPPRPVSAPSPPSAVPPLLPQGPAFAALQGKVADAESEGGLAASGRENCQDIVEAFVNSLSPICHHRTLAVEEYTQELWSSAVFPSTSLSRPRTPVKLVEAMQEQRDSMFLSATGLSRPRSPVKLVEAMQEQRDSMFLMSRPNTSPAVMSGSPPAQASQLQRNWARNFVSASQLEQADRLPRPSSTPSRQRLNKGRTSLLALEAKEDAFDNFGTYSLVHKSRASPACDKVNDHMVRNRFSGPDISDPDPAVVPKRPVTASHPSKKGYTNSPAKRPSSGKNRLFSDPEFGGHMRKSQAWVCMPDGYSASHERKLKFNVANRASAF